MQVIYGVNPLLESLLSQPAVLERIVAVQGRAGKALEKILTLAARQGIPVEWAARDALERLAPGRVHQGVVGLCREYRYSDLEAVIANRQADSRHSLVILLDSVTDPQNLGSIIRTAHCCGANGVVIPEDRAASVTPAVVKASAGAVQHLPVARVVNLRRAMETLQERGFWIYGAEGGADLDMRTPDYANPVGLVMGSEGQGLRPLIRRKCDFLISIPIRGKVASLNVSVAAGVILYEILGKWGKGS